MPILGAKSGSEGRKREKLGLEVFARRRRRKRIRANSIESDHEKEKRKGGRRRRGPCLYLCWSHDLFVLDHDLFVVEPLSALYL